jgi:hypothetical protein
VDSEEPISHIGVVGLGEIRNRHTHHKSWKGNILRAVEEQVINMNFFALVIVGMDNEFSRKPVYVSWIFKSRGNSAVAAPAVWTSDAGARLF